MSQHNSVLARPAALLAAASAMHGYSVPGRLRPTPGPYSTSTMSLDALRPYLEMMAPLKHVYVVTTRPVAGGPSPVPLALVFPPGRCASQSAQDIALETLANLGLFAVAPALQEERDTTHELLEVQTHLLEVEHQDAIREPGHNVLECEVCQCIETARELLGYEGGEA